jgi:thiol-disulfide isomerase/thioredoxin
MLNLNFLDTCILVLVVFLFYKFYFSENFENVESDHPTLTLYYAPWCGHCHKLLETGWKELPEEYHGVKMQKVDCTKKENKHLVRNLNIEGFPTILLKKNSKEHLEYRGNRTSKDILKFIEKNIVAVNNQPSVEHQHENQHGHHHGHQHVEQPKQQPESGFEPNFTAYYAPWCGHSKRLLEKSWKEMPPTYRGIKINKVDSTQPGNDKLIASIKDEQGARIVKGYPTMILELTPGRYNKYVGDRSSRHMLSFIDHQLEQNGMMKAQNTVQQESGSSSFKPNFSTYYAPWCGHSVRLLKDGWAKMPDNYKGLEIRAIDMTKDQNRHYSNAILKPDGSKYITGFPTILLEKTENNFVEYKGNRSYEDMIKFIDNNL